MLPVLAPAVATALILMAVLAWQQRGLPGHRHLSASLMGGAAFFLFKAWPQTMAFLLPVVLAAPLLVNRANRAVFEARQRLPAVDVVIFGLLMVSALMGFTGPRWPGTSAVYMGLSLLLFLDMPVVAWRSLPDDLMAARRNARLWVLGLGAILGAVVAIGAAVGQGEVATAFGALATLGLCLAAAVFGKQIVTTLAPVTTPAALDVREALVLRRLRGLMEDGAYTDAGLTLSRLAQRLDVPEHRLRRVIHIGEGQRNFSVYINGWRINAVKARMAEVPNATILELALEAGYASLSVFNRAFKEAEGVTPSAYRQARLPARTARTTARTPKTPEAASET